MIKSNEDVLDNIENADKPTEILDKIINGDLIVDCSVKELLEAITSKSEDRGK